MNNKRYKLFEKLIELSVAKDWDHAQAEWKLQFVSRGLFTCLCGKYPIMEQYHIVNIINDKMTVLGSCCIKLIGQQLHPSLFRVQANIEKPLSYPLIKQGYDDGILTDWEFRFYTDTFRIRKLYNKRLAKRIEINTKLLKQFLR